MTVTDSLAISTGHAVILLSSGLSQRLGTSKQLLTYQGQSLLQIMLTTALATYPQKVVVVVPKVNTGNLEDSANPIANPLQREVNRVVDSCDLPSERVLIVVNDCPETGMGHSLYLGIEGLKQLHLAPNHQVANQGSTKNGTADFQRVLIMGVDQILLDSDHLNALLDVSNEVVASRYAKDYKALSTDMDGARQKPIIGLPIAISFKQLVSWQSQLSGDVGLRHLLRALPEDKITTVDNLKLSLDIDTPQQRQFAIEHGWLDPKK